MSTRDICFSGIEPMYFLSVHYFMLNTKFTLWDVCLVSRSLASVQTTCALFRAGVTFKIIVAIKCSEFSVEI